VAISFQFSAAFAPGWKLIAENGQPPPRRELALGRRLAPKEGAYVGLPTTATTRSATGWDRTDRRRI